jgi:hypothetical protein
LIAKEINIDLKGVVSDKSSIVIQYNIANFNFSYESFAKDMIYDNVFSIVFNTNLKSGGELEVFSENSLMQDGFAFCDRNQSAMFKFYFYSSESGLGYGNRDVIFSWVDIKEPISKVISMGIKVPKIDSIDFNTTDLQMGFTIRLKNIG